MFKLSSLTNPTKAELKAEAHFGVDKKDWKDFEKTLRGSGFQKAILNHPKSDEKLQKYVKNFGAYLRAKDVVTSIPSRSKATKSYKIKKLPSGRMGCGCRDWQYVHSVNGTDCDHIKAVKAMKQKLSSSKAMLGAGFSHLYHHGKAELKKGKVMEDNVKRLRLGLPLEPVK